MRTLIAAASLMLSASAAMAGAPCENPVSPPCQKACAVMGAKYVLALQGRGAPLQARVQPARAGEPLARTASLVNAERLARFAGLSLDYINALSAEQIGRAIAAYCPK